MGPLDGRVRRRCLGDVAVLVRCASDDRPEVLDASALATLDKVPEVFESFGVRPDEHVHLRQGTTSGKGFGMTTIFCRFCNGSRHVNALKQCDGCGMPAANANVPESVRKQKTLRLKCPKCRGNHIREIEADRFNCETCDAVFEAADMGYVDDRPEINAMKKE